MAPAPLVWVRRLLFLLVAYWGVTEVVRMAAAYFGPDWARVAFYDFRLWRAGVETLVQTGRLYDTDSPGFFLPGSHSLFKYPPPFAALLRPFVGQPQELVGRGFLLGNFVLLGLTFVLLAWGLRLARWALAGGALGFVLWRPTWESLADLQMEPILLAGVVLAFLALRKGRDFTAGCALGAAGAFKVYPWIGLLYFAGRRRWRGLIGGVTGAVVTLGLSSIWIPPRVGMEFFTVILPRIGGTSLSYENLSLLGNLGRFASLLIDGSIAPAVLDQAVLEEPGRVPARLLALGVYGACLVGLLLASRRFIRSLSVGRAGISAVVRSEMTPVDRPAISSVDRSGVSSVARSEMTSVDRRGEIQALGFALFLTLSIFLIPTSWTSYQTLLVLPGLAVLLPSRPPALDRAQWVCLGASAVAGCIFYSYDEWFSRNPLLFSLIRSSVPLFLGVACARRMRSIARSAAA